MKYFRYSKIIYLALIIVIQISFVCFASLAEAADDSPAGSAVSVLGKAGEGMGYANNSSDMFLASLGGVIRAILGILGVVLAGNIVYGGYLWITSAGNPETVKKAKAWITNSIVGLVVTLSAYAITDYVITMSVTATGSGAQ